MDSYEAAAYLRINFKTVTRLAIKGKIPGQKVGARWRFLKAVLDEWLEGRQG
jgi:excisionase family DNA binding protein